MTTIEQVALDSPTRVQPLRALVICVAGAALCAIIPFVEYVALYALVLALGFAVILPAWYGWARGKLDYFEPVHIIGFIYFMFFGLGSIWVVHNPSRVAYDKYLAAYIPAATFYCLLGYLAFLAGYYGPWHKGKAPRRIHEKPVGTLFLLGVSVLGLVAFLAFASWSTAFIRGIRLPSAVSSLSQLWPVFIFAWGLAWLLFFKGTMTYGQKLVLFGILVPGVLVIGFMTFSDKSLAMTLLGVPVISLWYARRKIPWAFLIVLVLVLLFVVFPFYNTFRWFDASRSNSERLSMTYNTIVDWDSDMYWRFSFVTFQRRMAMINSVAVLVRDVGKWEPFARGKTIFMPTVAMFIPRVIWPEKPTTTQGQEFGRRFRVTNFLTRDSHIGATIPGELYWNFGLPGVILGLGLAGWGVRALYRRYGASSSLGPVPLAISIVLLVQLAHMLGATIANGLASMIRILIVLEAMRWFGLNYGLLNREDEDAVDSRASLARRRAAARSV